MIFRSILIGLVCFGCLYGTPNEPVPKNPKTAFLYSLIPGMGQAYNRKWLKSITIIGLEIAAYQAWEKNSSIYSNYNSEIHSLPKYRYLDKRNKYAWWIGFIYFYGMIDAIVDAHLHPFNHIMDQPIERNVKGENNQDEK